MSTNTIPTHRVRRWLSGLLLTVVLTGCASRIVPLNEHVSSGFMFVPVKVNGFATEFLLDTGATHTALAPQVAGRLGLIDTDTPRNTTVTTMSQTSGSAQVVKVKSLSIASTSITGDKQVMVVALDVLANALKRPVDGILGMQTLAQVKFMLNLANKSLTLRPASPCDTNSKVLGVSGYHLYATIPVNGTPLNFLIDSAASPSIVRKQDLEASGISYHGRREPRTNYNLFEKERVMTEFGEFDLVFDQVELRQETLKIGNTNVIGADLLKKGVLTVSAQFRCYSFVRAQT